jgi:hypothetical protein
MTTVKTNGGRTAGKRSGTKASREESVKTLRASALRLPETTEGVACKGTVLERCTVKARNKAFLFVDATGARLKLRESLSEAAELASEDPQRFKVGANGWVAVTFGEKAVPARILKRWIDESYRLMLGT